MKLTALILFVLVGLATTMSIYEALYPEDTFEDVLRTKSSLENAAMRVAPDYETVPLKRELPMAELVIILNPGWHEFSLVTIRCTLIGFALTIIAIAAMAKHRNGIEKRKADIIPLLLLTVLIDVFHSGFVVWYYNNVPERVEFDEYDRPSNLFYTSLSGCTLILNYLGQIWKLVAALEVGLALHRFLTIVCRLNCPTWTIFVLSGILAAAMIVVIICMHIFGEVFRSRFWCSYRYSEETGKEVLDFIHSLGLIGAIILHTTTLIYQMALSSQFLDILGDISMEIAAALQCFIRDCIHIRESSSIGVTLALLVVLPHAAIDAVIWQFGLHDYSYLFKLLPDNYHFHLAEYRLLILSASTIIFIEEVRSTLLSIPISLFNKTKSRFVHVKRPKVPAVNV
ncbi:hypothetical protein PRIPAC_89640 [Pristionchus pacificus]|uniref:Uncharacterized protein n=1 Tax=Pristionchus pacificus TaxID=54126 RepID=A0A2A6B646_PRIPA|nr:hypothetical protein PRIPAC_89640 [Pristionchus pacificus]|eukprot:PDM61347.1 hypothetical protein PRIPAC_50789 [Pristionchus pacificus]